MFKWFRKSDSGRERGKADQAGTPLKVDQFTLELARGDFNESPLIQSIKDEAWLARQWQLVEDELNEIVAAPVPMMKCRESLTNHIIVMCRYWVLVMKPPPDPEEAGFRGITPGNYFRHREGTIHN